VCRVLVGKPESKHGESHSLLNSVNDILTVFVRIVFLWIKVSTSDICKNLLSDHVFCKNWLGYSRKSASGMNVCLCVLSAFVV